MEILSRKQPLLKPQDLVVAIKLAVNKDRTLTFSELARELCLSASEVHTATKRAELSQLLIREDRRTIPNRISLREFIVHGAKYAYPASLGPVGRGVPTGTGATSLRQRFVDTKQHDIVWPDARGETRGTTILPLYPSIPSAVRLDHKLHEVLALFDILRIGSAREREMASVELGSRI